MRADDQLLQEFNGGTFEGAFRTPGDWHDAFRASRLGSKEVTDCR